MLLGWSLLLLYFFDFKWQLAAHMLFGVWGADAAVFLLVLQSELQDILLAVFWFGIDRLPVQDGVFWVHGGLERLLLFRLLVVLEWWLRISSQALLIRARWFNLNFPLHYIDVELFLSCCAIRGTRMATFFVDIGSQERNNALVGILAVDIKLVVIKFTFTSYC